MFLEHEQPLAELQGQLGSLLEQGEAVAAERLAEQIRALQERIFSQLTPLQRLQICRHPKRPRPLDLLNLMGAQFEELHGDRAFGDDPALRAGLATIAGHRCVVLASEKGGSTQERISRRFGMVNPEGYRKAQRVMQLAQRFRLPVLSLVDTAGAYPGLEAEERGQGWVIAETIALMGSLRVPILSVITGEGCSGGALALSVADWVALFEHAYFSVISPEGCSSILWKDRTAIGPAAAALKMQSEQLLSLGLIDQVIDEPSGGAHLDPSAAAAGLLQVVEKQFRMLSAVGLDSLLERRQARYRTLQFVPF
jgi:acetyl-CoA carboxylase carboxyl transferase subunit alpha